MGKTKIILSILLLNILFANGTFAQQQSSPGFYVKVYGGYGLLTPGSYNGGASYNSSSSTSSFSTPSNGLGGGLHFGGGIGIILNEFLNVGIDAEYLKGKDIKTTSLYQASDYYSISNNKISHNVTSIIPNVTFKAISKPAYYIYTRIGIVLAVSTNITTTYNDSSNNTSTTPNTVYTYVQSGKYTTKLSFGTSAAIGVQFNISGNLKGFAELVGYYLPSSPSSYTYNYNYQYTGPSPSNGSGSVTYNYVKSGDYTGSSPYNTPKITNNINYIGLNLGVAYKF
ncbi:MAG TPA: hypothetical protein VMT76_01115 [Puia sp.]|nr:hypothetical protein [Puia sp.]